LVIVPKFAVVPTTKARLPSSQVRAKPHVQHLD
jgi:hypothetical protein